MMKAARRSGWCALALAVVVATGCGFDDARPVNPEPSGAAAVETSAATTDAIATSSSVAPAPASSLAIDDVLVLRRDGLGVVSFGQDADESIAAVTAVLGEPDEDTGWVEPLSIGSCAGAAARYVAWGSLYLYFSDESGVAQGRRHLFGYSYGSERDLEAIPEGLATPEGIGLGTTVEFLRAAYGDVVVEEGEEGLIPPNFYVDESLSGRLTGGADDDLVTVIIGGDPCGVAM